MMRQKIVKRSRQRKELKRITELGGAASMAKYRHEEGTKRWRKKI